MKALLVSILALLPSIATVSQKIDSASLSHLAEGQQLEVKDLLDRAKELNNTALVLSIGGGALALIGSTVFWKSSDNNNEENYSPARAMIVAGGLCVLGSIPIFINVHHKRAKAKAIVFADGGISIAPHIIIPNTSSYVITIIIPFAN